MSMLNARRKVCLKYPTWPKAELITGALGETKIPAARTWKDPHIYPKSLE